MPKESLSEITPNISSQIEESPKKHEVIENEYKTLESLEIKYMERSKTLKTEPIHDKYYLTGFKEEIDYEEKEKTNSSSINTSKKQSYRDLYKKNKSGAMSSSTRESFVKSSPKATEKISNSVASPKYKTSYMSNKKH